MLISKDEIAKKVLAGEITDTESLNAVLRIVIKDVLETALKTEISGFLGYGKNQSPVNDTGNRRNGFTQKEVSSRLRPIELEVPRDRKSEWQNVCKKARVQMRPYDIRHIAATEMLARCADGAAVAAQLGHCSVAVTGSTYAHVTAGSQANAAAVMPAITEEENK